jgi:hypothetical protein
MESNKYFSGISGWLMLTLYKSDLFISLPKD